MRRRLDLLPQPPPPHPLPALIGGEFADTVGGGDSGGGGGAAVSSPTSPSRDNMVPSLLIIALILIAVFVFSVILHLLLRHLSCCCCCSNSSRSSSGNHETVTDHSHPSHRISSKRVSPDSQSLIDSLPLFSFDSVSGLKNSSTVDCAVCLSKFEQHDLLRLLPLCCHAFHAGCIDTWLMSCHTCPLCRSTIEVDESEEMSKLSSSLSSAGNSFRLEIGSFSEQRTVSVSDSGGLPSTRRSYSMGSFEYVVEENSQVVVVVEPMHTGGVSDSNLGLKDKDGEESPATNVLVPEPSGSHQVAAEVAAGSRRSSFNDYMDRLVLVSSTPSSFSSRSFSVRFSGRIFTGNSSRRREGTVEGTAETGSWDLEGNWITEEMSGFLRWLSGV